jgi:hypothetical protein
MSRAGFLGIALSVFSLSGPVLASDLPPLPEVSAIYMPLKKAAVARIVEQNCITISQRVWRVRFEGWKLYQEARKMGYSREEIEDFIKSKEEQDKAIDWAEGELDTLGVLIEDQPSICEYGKVEIEAGTLVGRLLKNNQ